jgi:hypothetical protein
LSRNLGLAQEKYPAIFVEAQHPGKENHPSSNNVDIVCKEVSEQKLVHCAEMSLVPLCNSAHPKSNGILIKLFDHKCTAINLNVKKPFLWLTDTAVAAPTGTYLGQNGPAFPKSKASERSATPRRSPRKLLQGAPIYSNGTEKTPFAKGIF